MSVKESLEKCLDVLPENRVRELLDFAEFLQWLEERRGRQESGSSEEDAAGAAWAMGVAQEWSAELSDAREDIYTPNDGETIRGRR